MKQQSFIARASGHVAIRPCRRTPVIARDDALLRLATRVGSAEHREESTEMSFGSGFGASTSTPAPTFAFGTTPASTATPVKPGKLFSPPSRNCEFLTRPSPFFPFLACLDLSVDRRNGHGAARPALTYLATVYVCDNFEVKNGKVLRQSVPGEEQSRTRRGNGLFLVPRRAGPAGHVGSLVQQGLAHTPAIRAALDVAFREEGMPAPGSCDDARRDAAHE